MKIRAALVITLTILQASAPAFAKPTSFYYLRRFVENIGGNIQTTWNNLFSSNSNNQPENGLPTPQSQPQQDSTESKNLTAMNPSEVNVVQQGNSKGSEGQQGDAGAFNASTAAKDEAKPEVQNAAKPHSVIEVKSQSQDANPVFAPGSEKQESESFLAPMKRNYPQLKEFCNGDGYTPDECSADALIAAKREFCDVQGNEVSEHCKEESIVVRFRSTVAPKDYPSLANFCREVQFADHACALPKLERMKNKFCAANSRSSLCEVAKVTIAKRVANPSLKRDQNPKPEKVEVITQPLPLVSKPDSLEEIRRKAAEETQKMYERRAEKARLAEQQRIDSELAEQERIHKLEVKEQERIAKEEKKKKLEDAKQKQSHKTASVATSGEAGSDKIDKALADKDLLTIAEIFGDEEFVASSTTKVCEVLRNIMDSPVPMTQDHIVKHALMKRLQFLNKVLDVNEFAVNGGDVRWDKKKYNEGIRNIARVGRRLRVSSYRSERLNLNGVAATWGRGAPEIFIKEEGKGALFCDARNRLSLIVDQSLVELIFWVQGPGNSTNSTKTLVMNPALRANDIRDLLDRRQKELKKSGMGYAVLQRLVELGNSIDDVKGDERRQRTIQFTDLQLLTIKVIRDEADKKGPGAGIIDREQAHSLKAMLNKGPTKEQLSLTIDKAAGAE